MRLVKVGNLMFRKDSVVGLHLQESTLKISLSSGVEYSLEGAEAQRVWDEFDAHSEDLMSAPAEFCFASIKR